MLNLPLLVIVIFLLPLLSGTAIAESFSEIKPVKGLLLFEGFQQWLNLSYNYSGTQTSLSKSANHALEESYNASLQMALFDPHILDTTLQGSIVFDQNWNRNTSDSSASNTNSGSDITYQYNFFGNGLDKSRIPFSLLSYRNINTVQNTFTSPTTTDMSGNEFGITFLNEKLKSNFRYSNNSSDTRMNGRSSNSFSNAYTYTAEHHSTSSTTSLTAAFSDQKGGTSNGEKLTSSTNSLALNNVLIFGARQNYSLLSFLQLNNTTVDNLPTRNITFLESFGANPGRALSMNASYSLAESRSTDQIGTVQEKTRNRGELSIRHKLYESLLTELQGIVILNNENGGTENQSTVRGNAIYSKKLSPDSQMSLSVSNSYDLVDRNLSTGITTVRDELHPVVHQGDTINLALSGGTLRSIEITSRNPIFTYVEGVDYTVNYSLGRITILTGGGVRIDMDGTGTDLYLTYSVYKDPQLKYTANMLSLISNLTLLDNQINLGASWQKTGYSVISGPATNSLQDVHSLMLYVSGSYDSTTVRVTYQNEVTGELKSQTYDGNVSTIWQTANATISLSARDSYSKYEGTSTSAAYRENTSDVVLMYTRNILTDTTLILQGNANDSRSDLRPARDSLSLRGSCQFSVNKIFFNLFAQTAWMIEKNSTSRTDSALINLIRYF